MNVTASLSRPLLSVGYGMCGLGALLLGVAGVSLVAGANAAHLAGVAVFLAVSVVAERFPVPLAAGEGRGPTLTFAFGVAAGVLFGWPAGTLVLAGGPAAARMLGGRGRHDPLSAHLLAAVPATAAGVIAAPLAGDGAALLAAAVAAMAAAYLVGHVAVAVVAARSGLRRSSATRWSGVPRATAAYALMASAALALVVLWQRSPLLSLALAGPLLAIVLYGRAADRALRATRLALTDPITGLGNHRDFHERLRRELTLAATRSTPLSLCLLDVDDFKLVNDRHGHPIGDRVLAQISAQLRHGGESFRLGGDEFAVLLPRSDPDEGLTAAHAIARRLAAVDFAGGSSVTASAGLATFPGDASDADELVRRADAALYWAKEHGKNRVRAYGGEVVELGGRRRVQGESERRARIRAALSLARAAEARDAFDGRHFERVADLAARIALRLGCDDDEVSAARLAGSLHDLGKVAVGDEVLCKAGRLDEDERASVERHPEIGSRMLESLGLDHVATWVLHHHERWDGDGYPEGLSRDEIPLVARILFVADAFDAMTSELSYRLPLSREEGILELERCSGSQFDPEVVAALAVELGHPVPRSLRVLVG